MCHTIEDPTFDATAMATSPYAQIRPVHRPPRTPEGRHPHCHWTATIDPERAPLPEPEPAVHMASTRLAQLPVPVIDRGVGDPDSAGWSDYTAPMDPDLRLEQFSASALVGLAHEIAVQSHLLVMSFLFAIERRHGREAATDVGRQQLSGIAGLAAERLRDACGLDRSLAGVAQVLELHPLLQPRDYIAATVSLDEPAGSLRIGLSACPALEEDHLNWPQLLVDGNDDGLTTLVRGVDPCHDVERVDPSGDEVAAWQVVTADRPARESRLVALTRFSTGADFRFTETPVSLSEI